MARISKHDLKEDKFVTSMLLSYDYVRDNLNYVLGFVIILAIIGGGIYGYISFRGNIVSSRVEMLGSAELSLRYNDFQGADSLLRNLVENHAQSESGKKATFLLANLELTKFAKFDEAIELFNKYIENPIENESELVVAAKVGIAAANEEKKEFVPAAEKYIAVYEEHPEYFDREMLLLSAGRCYKYASDFEQAVNTYQRFIDNHEDSQNLDKAQIALARIKAMAMK